MVTARILCCSGRHISSRQTRSLPCVRAATHGSGVLHLQTRLNSQLRNNSANDEARYSTYRPPEPRGLPVSRPASQSGHRPLHDKSFYQRYLNFKILPYETKACAWATFLRPDNVQGKLPLPKDFPLDVFSDMTIGLDTARQALETYIANQNAAPGSSKSTRRQQYEKDQPGARALMWYIESNGYHCMDLRDNIRFIRAITYCMAGEGREAELWTWLSIEETPQYAISWNLLEKIQWKASVLRSMLEATIYWAQSSSKGLELARGQFFKALEIDRQIMSRRGQIDRSSDGSLTFTIPTAMPGRWLVKQHYGVHLPLKTAASVDKLISSTAIFSKSKEDHQFMRLKLLLNHPSNPDPTPALEFFRSCESCQPRTPFLQDWDTIQDRSAGSMRLYLLIRVAQLLHQQGAFQDACWVLDYGKTQFPELFSGDHPVAHLEHLPKATTKKLMGHGPSENALRRGVSSPTPESLERSVRMANQTMSLRDEHQNLKTSKLENSTDRYHRPRPKP